ncbi:MFS transporter [Streptosporangium sp. NPDC000396]|uniref:MFS transporter n=1 Tax=Streptosporangium sp. NPDC000396 TaxID=3366185 RepID=UPI00368FBAD7
MTATPADPVETTDPVPVETTGSVLGETADLMPVETADPLPGEGAHSASGSAPVSARTASPGEGAAGSPGPAASGGLGRRFWSLFASSTVSNLGDGIGRVALPLLAVTLTRDPVLVAALSSLTFLPWVLFAIVSGALVDRLDRRKAMVVAEFTRAVVVGLLAAAVLTGQAAMWMLFVAAFALGAIETIYDNAVHSLLPAVVRRDQLEKANGRVEAAAVVTDGFLGAPVGSALFVVAAAIPFMANSVGFLLAGVLLFLLPGRYRAEAVSDRPANLRREIGEGVRWLWNHKALRGITLIGTLSAGMNQAAMAVLVLFVVDVLRLPAAAFGWFALASGAGGVAGGLVAPVLVRRWPRAAVMAVAMTVSGAGFTLAGLFPSTAMLAIVSTLVGGSLLVWNVLIMSVRQTLIPAHLFGRVLGVIRTLLWGLIPVGALGGGLLAGAFGLRTVFVISGCVMLALMVPLCLVLWRYRALLNTLGGSRTVDT